jgi:hypothetical protein
MGAAKNIIVKVIPSKIANEFVKKYHYSGKIVNNSSLHFGAFLDNKLHGVMSFGSPLDKRKVLPLVHTSDNETCLWNEMLELNRMAFDDVLPKNSESRCIAIAFKLIKKNAPHIKWILSFSDATQCGDGTIYRASGFSLTQISPSKSNLIMPCGSIINNLSITAHSLSIGGQIEGLIKKYNIKITGKSSPKLFIDAGGKWLEGFQLRYIYLLDKTCKLNCSNLEYSLIKEMGAKMYKGIKK